MKSLPVLYAHLLCAAFFSSSLLIGCGGGGGGGGGKKINPSSTASPATPVSVDLSAGSSTISSGQSTLLVWNAPNATAVVSSNFGATTPTGSATVQPATTTTYSITVRNAQGNEATDRTTVTVVPVGVTATPISASLGISQSARFNANVTGTSDTRVTWAVQEPTGGSITQDGVYSAPAEPGTYHIVAISMVDANKFARVEVRVFAASGTVILN